MDRMHAPRADERAANIAAGAHSTLAARLRSAARTRAATLLGACLIALCSAAALPAIAAAVPTTGISGTVTNADEGNTPLAGVEVCARPEAGGAQECEPTDSKGEYTVEVAEGEYELSFEKSGFFSEWLFEVEVTSGELTELGPVGLDEEGDGTITGTVTAAATGQPIGGVEVCAYGCTQTAANGTYTFSDVPAGTSSAYFWPGAACEEEMEVKVRCVPNSNYLEQELEAVRVRVGQTTTANVALQAGGEITGTVTNASITHPALAKVEVCAYKVNAKGEDGPEREHEEWVYGYGCAYTNASGQYTITGLTSASWKVEFNGYVCTVVQKELEQMTCPNLYVESFYHGASSFRASTAVAVTAGAQTAGIDESLREAFPKTPASTAAPTVTGTPAVASTLTCSTGAWSGEPLFLTYQWQRDGAAIAGASGTTYAVSSADEGHSLTCVVLAGNGAGAASAASNAVAVAKPIVKRVAVAAHLAKVKGGKALLRITCSGGVTCSGSLKLVAKQVIKRHHKRHVSTVTIGTARFSVAAGKTATVRVHLNAKGKALLRASAQRKLKVKLAGSGMKASTVLLKEAKKAAHHKKGK